VLNRRVPRLYLASVILALAFAAPCSADTQRIHIDNFGQVSPTYYRGGQPAGSDYADLAALGVKTVINLTSDDARGDEPAMTARAGMKYVQIPMKTRIVPTPAQLAEFFKVVDDPANQPVFVHCVGGHHRTGVMTAVYRMTEDGWTSAQAFKEMKHFGFGLDALHPEFKAFVYGYPAMMARALAAVPAEVKANQN
jgi:uncharacterized protein (TIGR01244 family)